MSHDIDPPPSQVDGTEERGRFIWNKWFNNLYEKIKELVVAYGEISIISNSTETSIASQNAYVQVTVFDTNGEKNLTTPDHTNNHITIDKTGVYLINCPITINSVGGAGSTAEFEVKKNNGASRVGALHVDRTLAGGGAESGSASMSGIVSLTANDTIEVWVKNEDNTQNYIVEDITLSVVKIGS